MRLFETGFVFDLNIKKMMGWHDGTKPCSGNQNSCMDSECDWGPLSFYFHFYLVIIPVEEEMSYWSVYKEFII